MNQALKIEDIRKEFEALNYNLITDTYKNKLTIITYYCDKGHKNEKPYGISKNIQHRCNICTNNFKYTINDVSEKLNEHGCALISTTYKSGVPIHYICKNGHENKVHFSSWLRSESKCKTCTINSRKCKYGDVKVFLDKIGFELVTTEQVFDLIKHGMTADIIIEFKCDNDHINKSKFIYLKAGYKCSICSNKKKHTIDKVRENMELYDYTLISTEYINSKTKLKFICPKGHIGEMPYGNFLSGNRCGLCIKYSKGEEQINLYLQSMEIYYETQKKFDDCRNILPLPFDIYVNNDYLIEYDGQQHFEQREFFGGVNGFNKTRTNDKIKTKYCKDNRIILLRICYKDFKNINTILTVFNNNLATYKKSNKFIYYSDESMYDWLED